METYNYKGCEISINNNSSIISDNDAYYFCSRYIEYFLEDEANSKKGKRKNAFVLLENDSNYITVILDEKWHVKLEIRRFHSAKIRMNGYNKYRSHFLKKLHSDFHDWDNGVSLIEDVIFFETASQYAKKEKSKELH